jgi:L-threonylcarbamoyladenylate synthase
MLESHYAPHARVHIIDNIDRIPESTSGAGLIADANHSTPEHVIRLAEPHDAVDYAKILYAALRKGDEDNCEIIYVIPPQGEGLAAAVRDRVQRAAH